jgi:hypothetical protein
MYARVRTLTVAALVLLGVAAYTPASAQVAVSSADIERLQDSVYEVGSDISRLRSRDRDLAERLQVELDDLRDEVIYLKVRLRKERSVPRAEYSSVRDRLQDLRSRAISGRDTARGSSGTTGSTTGSSAPVSSATGPNTVPAGTELDLRLQSALSSETSQVEDRFEATTLVDVTRENGSVLIPAGSVVRGVVSSVDRASRTDRKGSLTVHFDEMRINGRSYPIRGTVTQALESEGIRGELPRIGTGAGVGAVIGGILGGVKGAIAGILIGAGGTVAATEGEDVDLPPGTVLRMRLDTPVTVR